jgi:hypothetical protein
MESIGEKKTLIRYSSKSGLSPDSAIGIHGASGDIEGIGAEYAWIYERYPNCLIQSRGEIDGKGRHLDWYVLWIRKSNKLERIPLWFDSTEFYGKGIGCH